jgi:hypothetical protein
MRQDTLKLPAHHFSMGIGPLIEGLGTGLGQVFDPPQKAKQDVGHGSLVYRPKGDGSTIKGASKFL